MVDKNIPHSTILIGKNTVTKSAEPGLMRVEVEKTRRAIEIAKNCNRFRVPEILDYDEARGVLVSERLKINPAVTGCFGKQGLQLAKDLGAALAFIHRDMILPAEMLIPLPEEFPSSHESVFIHGDLGLGNVCMEEGYPPSIVIIDWQMSPNHGGRSTFGSRYFDIIWFVVSLTYNRSIRFVLGNPAKPVIETFLESYFTEADISYNKQEAIEYAVRIFRLKGSHIRKRLAQQRYGRARLLFPFNLYASEDVIDLLKII